MLSNLYKILKKEDGVFAIELACREHSVFQAHFPNNPLLPAFIMMEICSEVLNHEITGIKKAKFIHPALPEDVLDFFFIEREKIVSVKIQKNSVKIAEILYEKI
ncbi:MAG: hypothetical protein R3331_04015 [Sulfurospirillaceae bacterium]|nr:hypothetical protein [Sulfurospirillaceae bacterium]